MNRNPLIENSPSLQPSRRMLATPAPVDRRSPLEIRRVAGDYERPSADEENETAPQPNTCNRLDWTMVALWLFVSICFGALAFSIYLIWRKCGGDSPFRLAHLGAITPFLRSLF